MMNDGAMIPISLVLIPVLFSLLNLAIPSHKARKIVTYIGGGVIALLSFLLWLKTPIQVSLHPNVNSLIILLDYALIFYFLKEGIVYKHRTIVSLTTVQLVLLSILVAYFHTESTYFIVDRLSAVMALIVGTVGSTIAVYSTRYMEEGEDLNRENRFLSVIFLFLGAMNALVFSDNLEWIFFFYECTTFTSYYLIGYRRDELSIRNSLLALWMNQIGGIAILLSAISSAYIHGTILVQELIKTGALLPISLIVIGAMVKSAQVPFQSWLLGAMVAPTPVSALLHSSTMVKIGPYLVFRVSDVMDGTTLGSVVALAGAFTFTSALVMALSQIEFKRLLAYSTIASLGAMILCGGIGTPLAITAGITLLVFHAVSKAFLFLEAGISEKEFHAKTLEELFGLITKGPITAWMITFGAIAMALPPFGMFIGKWILIQAAVISKQYLTLFLLVFGSAVSVIVYMKLIGRVLAGRETERPRKSESLSPTYLITTLVCVIAIAILTLFYTSFANSVIEKVTEDIIHKSLIESGIREKGLGLILNAGRIDSWQLLLLFSLAFALPILGYFHTWRKADLVYEYTCGEPIEPNLGAYYFLDKLNDEHLSRIFNPIASVFLLLILLMGVL